MKGFGKKNMEIILIQLKEVRDSATLENADFPKKLKDTVKLHHTSWIVHPLDDIIAFMELVIKRKYSGEYHGYFGHTEWKKLITPNPGDGDGK